jgi:hypothetical protein
MVGFELKDALELLGLGATILACTWKLSAQIAKLEATLALHIHQDERTFSDVWEAIDGIAPRAPHLRAVKR